MNKNIIKLFLLSIILLLISSIVILKFGKEYEMSFSVGTRDIVSIREDNRTGIIKIIDKKKVDDVYYVRIKAIKPGKAEVIVNYGDYGEMKSFYIHKSLVITDGGYFGKSNCSKVIPISLSIILIYGLVLLIKKYKSSINDNLYQYKNVAYLGIIIFLLFFILNNIIGIFNYQGIYDTVNKIINSVSIVSFYLLPIAFITFLLVTISNINLIRKEGFSLRNLLGVLLGMFLCFSPFIPDIAYKILMKTQIVDIYNLNAPGPYIYNFIESVIYLTISYLECILLGTIIITIKSVKRKIKYNKDYIIILGCQIRKDGSLTPLLKGRVDKAIEFRNEQLKNTNKDLIFIPSGGKGEDEIISEAVAMKNYLIKNGIKSRNILIEDKSKNTYENIKFSNKLIKNKKANVAFSTTNYHVFRAGLIASEQGLKLEGIGSKTKAYFWINAFIREFIGTLYSEKKKHIIVFIMIMIALIIMITITYFANNI